MGFRFRVKIIEHQVEYQMEHEIETGITLDAISEAMCLGFTGLQLRDNELRIQGFWMRVSGVRIGDYGL